jgi:argininosuccinate lyase
MTDGPLWGGRFTDGPDPEMIRLTSSLDVDIELLPYDLAATRAHARALEKAGLLDGDEVFAIDETCDEILARVQRGEVTVDGTIEDVHSLVERLLTDMLGDTGKRIHAGRSRNDLVATDLHLWCRDAAVELIHLVGGFIGVLARIAGEHKDTLMPGYTHLQRAQPVSLAFHLAAHGFALARDAQRFENARRAADVSTLGAGALAGTTLSLDPSVAATELGFTDIFDNAMDAVSDRDFAVDLAYACALCGVHLSRLSEEIVLWTSSEFGFARIHDSWSTGSSMMPQKRNPDVAELTRGRAAIGIGELTSLLSLLKGLPLAYNRDLQEDKALVFGIVNRAKVCLESMTALVGALTFDTGRLEEAARAGAAWATDVSEALVERGVPFRAAHEVAGDLVASLERGDASIDAEGLAAAHPQLNAGDTALTDVRRGMEARQGPGGTSPERLEEQLLKLNALAERLLQA